MKCEKRGSFLGPMKRTQQKMPKDLVLSSWFDAILSDDAAENSGRREGP